MPRPRTRVPALALLVCLVVPAPRAMAQPCAGTASVTIAADNLSADATLSVVVAGELVDAASTCSGGGSTTYAAVLTCSGGTMVRCGRITGLRPGQWIHRFAVQVSGSDPQVQAQRTVLLGGDAGEVSNAVAWTVFPRTFIVGAVTDAALRTAITGAAAFTVGDPDRRALVTFSATAFPGADEPKTIFVRHTPPITCTDETCSDGRKTGLCFAGSGIVVDALDVDARAGGVVLSAGTCNRSLMRVLGNDNVFRGLVFVGGQKGNPKIDVDTVAITGANDPEGDFGQGNRFEQCTFRGPTKGDAVSVERGAADTVMRECDIWGAEDKGLKAQSTGTVRLERSCVHDNRNGGVQSTLGGVIDARENVVQHNVPGAAQNGLFVQSTNTDRSFMTTEGNIVRFNGSRGVTVVDNGEGHFRHDYIADNAFAGGRVETTIDSVMPQVLPVPVATFRGVAFVCNKVHPIAGECHTGAVFTGQKCQFDPNPLLLQCPAGQTCQPKPPIPAGTGFVAASCGTCSSPSLDLGTSGDQGRNAFTLNENTLEGTNVNNATGDVFTARANQWEHCVADGDFKCGEDGILGNDVLPPSTSASPAVVVGTPTAHFRGVPVVDRTSARRPRKGERVHLYGVNFNAIDAAACAGTTLPEAPCSAENPALAEANRTNLTRGHRILLTIGGMTIDPDVVPIQALTPTMIAFEMPVDCFGPATVRVAKGNDPGDVSAPLTFCDPLGCAGEGNSTPCDDGDGCTFDDHCSGDGACVPGTTVTCEGQCLTGGCDPEQGCVPRAATVTCDDADACTTGDHCSGTDAACVGTTPVVCVGQCFTGACDPQSGCVPADAVSSCDDENPCTTGEHCSGVDGDCTGGVPTDCDDGNACTDDLCDAKVGCVHIGHAEGSQCAPANGCFPPSTCQSGQCELISEPACDDGDACTDDTCEGQDGCRYTAIAEIPGVACRVGQVRVLLQEVPSTLAALARKQRRRLGKIDIQLTVAETAKDEGNTRRMLRKLDQAANGLGRVERTFQRASTLPLTLGRQLRDATAAAIDQLEAFRAASGG